MGIGSVNKIARETSSYSSRHDQETSRIDEQQLRLDSLEDQQLLLRICSTLWPLEPDYAESVGC